MRIRDMGFLGFTAFALLLAQDGEWLHYGNDAGGSRHSPLTRINKTNVGKLRVAWTHNTGAIGSDSPINRKAAFEATPLLSRGTLYLTTPFSQVVALDGATGERKWFFDPDVDRKQNYSEVTSRGVALWRSGAEERILFGTLDGRLISLDAKSGRKLGEVSLIADAKPRHKPDYTITSPPVVIGDVVVTGSSIGDNGSVESARGIVRGYDIRTLKLKWTWDPLPDNKGTGSANAWSVISADAKLGLVFVPTGSPSPDFYGGERPGDNRFANSVTALRASTGEVAWSFQVVHHDLWDYDVASQPNLIEYKGTPAVAVTTKIGHVFVLDRKSGEPLVPVEERAVPKSDVPGEKASPTQPFPAWPAVTPQRITVEDAWGPTPEMKKWCEDRIREVRNEGVFTPPSLGAGSLLFPGNVGGVNWGSAAYDPKRKLLIMASNRLATIVRLIPRVEFEKQRRAGADDRLMGEFGTQAGTPYGMYRQQFVSPAGVPCVKPPFGTLYALDLETGRAKWDVPLGKAGPIDGTISLGGPLSTAGGLIFIAATRGEQKLRAFDADTGTLLWEGDLPFAGHATPMSYEIGGKQYIVVSAGGHGKLGETVGDAVVAWSVE